MRSRANVVDSAFQRVWQVVRRIRRGRVATYGWVAAHAGLGRGARVVSYALRAAPDGHVPWQRVVGQAKPGWARVSIRDPLGGAVQRDLLEQEGVVFDARGWISLEDFGAAAPKTKKPPPARGGGSKRRR